MSTAAVRRITDDERRARLGVRHRLARHADLPVAALAADLVAVHATDPATVYLSLLARLPGAGTEDVERALYTDRLLVRMLAMRRTMFVVAAELVPVVQAAASRAVAAAQRRLLVSLVEQNGIASDGEAWTRRTAELTMAALRSRGQATASQLAEDVPELRRTVLLAPGKSYGGPQRLSGRVLLVLSAQGHVVRGRPNGSWVSSQYQWVAADRWPVADPTGAGLSVPDAQAELVRRWLARYGPGTEADLRWWTGWTATQVRRALAQVATVPVQLDGGTSGLVLADDVDPVEAPEPWVAFLPALDVTSMGWTERRWYLGEHRAALFDRNGNIGPTVWHDGRIVGGWAQTAGGAVVHRLLQDVGAEVAAAAVACAARLTERLAGVRVTPRFRTPLETELGASGR